MPGCVSTPAPAPTCVKACQSREGLASLSPRGLRSMRGSPSDRILNLHGDLEGTAPGGSCLPAMQATALSHPLRAPLGALEQAVPQQLASCL